ncbi:MAG: CHAT domain-containing protein [Spirulina sp. SIO3F2]|nr:CHAT domain-containing protein [Spirulina sp. SIO3F2]
MKLATTLSLLLTLFLGNSALTTPIAATPQQQLAQTNDDLDWERRHELRWQGLEQLSDGDYAGAIATYEQVWRSAAAAEDYFDYTNALLGLAKATLAIKDYDRAIPMWEVLATRFLTKYEHKTALSFANLGLALYHTQDYEKAEWALQEAIANWEIVRADRDDLEQITLFEQQSYTYRLLQKVLVAQGKTEEALVVAEFSRGQALVEQLVQQYDPNDVVPDLTLEEIRQTAREQDTTIVLYGLVGEEVRVVGTEANLPNELFIWVVQPDGRIGFRNVDLAAANITSLRHFVHRTRNEAVRRHSEGPEVNATLPGDTFSEQMYQLLIEPIADLLPSAPQAQVTFIPQDALFLVPFAALKDANGTYLIEKHTLASAPSVQVMRLAEDDANNNTATNGSHAPLIVGNPNMPTIPEQDRPLIPLPAAEAEAKVIAKLLGTEPLLREAASETQILKTISEAPIIHFATHGLLDLDSQLNIYGDSVVDDLPTARDLGVFITPGGTTVSDRTTIDGLPAAPFLSREKVFVVELAGALALTPTARADGFLTSQEIAQLELAADLVVLSACDTGQGRVTDDGVVGLARSFMAAGADTVVVSLWAIPDAPTAKLMVSFYQKLAEHGDKAQALREAMLATKETYPHPMNWAAFTLMGSPL